MRDRYPPHRPEQEWPGTGTSRPGISQPGDPTLRLDDPGGSSRTEGLRRLSRLTWRTTQLSVIAAAAFAVLFARSAPARTASSQTTVKPSPAASPTHTHTPSPAPTHSRRAAARKKKAHQAPPSTPSAPAAAQPSAPPPSPTLAPPSAPPAPAPAPSPVQTTSSGSTGGG